jgi:hypothetical protein
LGQSLYAKLSVLEAVPFVLALIAASYGVVRLRLAWPLLQTLLRKQAKA